MPSIHAVVQMRRVQLAPTAMIAKSPSPLEISECEAAIVPLCFPNDNEGAPPPLSHPTYNDTDGCTLGHNAEGETVYYNIKKVLNNADMLSAYPEVIVPADHDVTLLDGLDGMKSSFMCILEWAHYIPEFARLSNYERHLLIDNSWCALSTLQLAANNQTASTIFQLGNGLCFSFQQIQDQSLRHLVNRVKDEIVSWLNTMSIDGVELAHIKALLLFNSGKPCMHARVHGNYYYTSIPSCRNKATEFRVESYCTAVSRSDPYLSQRSHQFSLPVSSIKAPPHLAAHSFNQISKPGLVTAYG